MFHFWFIPLLIVLVAIVCLLYMSVRVKGDSGVRTEGRTVHDLPTEDENPPP